MPAVIAILAGLVFGGAGALLSLARTGYDNVAGVAIGNFLGNLVIIFFLDWLGIFYGRPMMTFPGLIIFAFIDVLVMLLVAGAADLAAESFGAATGVAALLLVAVSVTWSVGVNSGHDAHKAAYGIVHVTEYTNDQLPASTTSNMVIVTPDIAANRASTAMSSGVAGSRNFSSYLDLGPATLQMIAGHMWYVFPLEFQGAINKSRLHGLEPGYIMVSAEDPNAAVVERYDGPYAMTVSLGGGQGSEPDRWVRSHGYGGYLLDDATLEINDNGDPYYTVTLLRPQLGWTFPAPVGVLLISAHTGQITRYDLPGRGLANPVPSWVDRVYGAGMATQIAGWYGFYGHAPFGGQGNTNRYQISGDPVMVYTGNGHPSWRMLLTSYGNETSTYRIIEMNAATGAIQVYQPAQPMGIEDPVSQAFASGSGVGAQLIKANHYTPAGLTLHVIYGHLTWMVSYEPEGTHPTFTGLGFLDAYHASANNVAFGATKAQALANYLQQLATEQNANGNAPGAGGTEATVTGTIANIAWDIQGGAKYYYITLAGAAGRSVVYSGTSALGPAIVVAAPGDHVIIGVLKVTQHDAQQTMESFSDAQHPLAPAGS